MSLPVTLRGGLDFVRVQSIYPSGASTFPSYYLFLLAQETQKETFKVINITKFETQVPNCLEMYV